MLLRQLIFDEQSVVLKNCLFLIDQSFNDSEDTEILELAMSEVERLSGIVGSLRDVYRPRVDVKFQPSPIAPLLADVAMLLETHLRHNKVTWEKVSSKADYAMIDGFPDQLKQVFLNFSLNAIEAMQPEGGVLTIMVTVNENEKQIGIAFSDSGPGISEDAMKFIFEPFSRYFAARFIFYTLGEASAVAHVEVNFVA